MEDKPTMLGVKKTKNELKEYGITEYMLRSWIKEGKIVSVKIGNKFLINVDKLIEYLNTNREG